MKILSKLLITLIPAILISLFFCSQVEAKVELTDIDGHWAEEDIKKLVGLGIINGYEDGTFRPNNPVTVAEFIKLVLFAYSEENYWNEREWKPEIVNQAQGNYQMKLNTTFFNGLPGQTYWAEPYIRTAINLELIPERNQWERNYNVGIKRSELALVAHNLLKFTEDANHHSYLELVRHHIKDYDRIPVEAEKAAVLDLYVKGLMQGYDTGYFGVDRVVTRAESLAIINRMLDSSLRKPNPPDLSIYPHAYVPAFYGNVPVVFPNEKSKQVYEAVQYSKNKTGGVYYDGIASTIFFKDSAEKEAYIKYYNAYFLGEIPISDLTIVTHLGHEHYSLHLQTDSDAYNRNKEPIQAFLKALFDNEFLKAEAEILEVLNAVANQQIKEKKEVTIGNYRLIFMYDDRTYSSISIGINLIN